MKNSQVLLGFSYCYLLTLLNLSGVTSVRLLKLSVPGHKFVGDEGVLSCRFDLEGEELYSVKWYKDNNEFYRFIPGERDQKITIFKLPGVKVDERRSNTNQVTLQDLNLKSAGNYRCEVSAEAPLFNTVSQRSKLSIIVLPNGRPRISGGKHTYHVGDYVRVNCTSDRSKPAATLHWYINGRQALPSLLHPYLPIQHEDGLETAIEGLEFKVTEATFRQQRGSLGLTLKCVSSISTTDEKSRFTETHHRKESVHSSFGSLFSAGTSQVWPSLSFTTLAILLWTLR